jgi:hypothetical protein
MNAGVVVGGWEFVWTAYVLTGIVFFGYAISLIVKVRAEAARDAMDGDAK